MQKQTGEEDLMKIQRTENFPLFDQHFCDFDSIRLMKAQNFALLSEKTA